MERIDAQVLRDLRHRKLRGDQLLACGSVYPVVAWPRDRWRAYTQVHFPRPGAAKHGAVRETASITGKLKTTARGTGCAVLLVAHLNRSLEQRPDQTPRLSDLRESGAIEQDADAVILLDRPDLRGDLARVGSDEPKPVACYVPKRRGSPPGKCSLLFDPLTLRFDPDEEAEFHAQIDRASRR